MAVVADSDGLEQAAARLLGRDVKAVTRAAAGGNNRLYCVEDEDGSRYALKTYLAAANDDRDRLGAERAGLLFVSRHGSGRVPGCLAAEPEAGLALFEWIEGLPVATPTPMDIDSALDFLAELKSMRARPGSQSLPEASEACLSAAELCRQIGHRRRRLFEAGDVRAAEFLMRRFPLAWSRSERRARRGYASLELDFDAPLAVERRTLSPSDFGFHNALRRPDDGLVFLDFEYFGWDDPVKLVADFLLHPGMRLPEPLTRRFHSGAVRLFQDEATFAARLDLLYPLYGLRWCLILLNAFLPEAWQRQAYARDGIARDEIRNRQLAKAKAMLAHVIEIQGALDHDA